VADFTATKVQRRSSRLDPTSRALRVSILNSSPEACYRSTIVAPSQHAGPLRLWPTPKIELISDPIRARARLEELLAKNPPAFGIAYATSAQQAPPTYPSRTRHTPTTQDPETVVGLAIATDAEASVLLIEPGPNTDSIDLVAMFRDLARPLPYLVFADAHRALQALPTFTRLGQRCGCTKTAATLLAAGIDGKRDDRPLEECIGPTLHRRLPDRWAPIDDGGQALRVRLASEAQCTLALMRHQTALLRNRGLNRVYTFECRLLPAVIAMETAGMPVDAAAFESVAVAWELERSTATDTARCKRLDKLISTYRHWARDYARNGRMRYRLEPLATDSGRFSCASPNLQQLPAEHTAPGLRKTFCAPEGSCLVVADYSQIELRVAAHLAPCSELRKVFLRGRDPHRATAATMTGKTEDEISTRERQLAKAINFGFLFGMGAPRFRSYALTSFGLSLDEAEAHKAREAFFCAYPGIADWHRRTAQLGRSSGGRPVTVTTAMGRQRRFPAGKFAFNAALNIPIQGSAAEGFKLALRLLHPALASLGGRGVLCVHDEYIAEVPRTRAQEAKTLVQKTMQNAMQTLITSVPIAVDVAIVSSWGDK